MLKWFVPALMLATATPAVSQDAMDIIAMSAAIDYPTLHLQECKNYLADNDAHIRRRQEFWNYYGRHQMMWCEVVVGGWRYQ
jgi:hypothetical protein